MTTRLTAAPALALWVVLASGCYDTIDLADAGHPCSACRECERCEIGDAGAIRCSIIPEALAACALDGDVHWFDACGEVEGEQIEHCLPCEQCVETDGGTAGCAPLEERAIRQCGTDGHVHWYDSCGVEGAIAESCEAGCVDISSEDAVCV